MKGLHTLKKAHGSTHTMKRLGRGNGSGKGSFSGKGIKGQRARAGGRSGILARSMKAYMLRIPKVRGFRSFHKPIAIVTLGSLQKHFADGAKVSVHDLFKKGLIGSMQNRVKILASGTLQKKLTVSAHHFSEQAAAAIEKAGGQVKRLVIDKTKSVAEEGKK